jgi:DNA-binding LytR/AlgR family response regulator
MLKILIVEDDLITATDIKEILEENKCHVEIGQSYSQALELFASFKPSAVFLDINLRHSVLNGIQIAEEIKKSNSNTPIIFITAHSEKATIQKAYSVEPFQFLVKPFSQKQIEVEIARIQQFLNGKVGASDEIKKLNEAEVLFIPHANGRWRIDKKEIVYIKSFEGYIEIYLVDQVSPHRITNKLNEMLNLLSSEYFIQIHRSYIINLNYLTSFTNTNVNLTGIDFKIPISASRKAELEKKLPIVKTRM